MFFVEPSILTASLLEEVSLKNSLDVVLSAITVLLKAVGKNLIPIVNAFAIDIWLVVCRLLVSALTKVKSPVDAL